MVWHLTLSDVLRPSEALPFLKQKEGTGWGAGPRPSQLLQGTLEEVRNHQLNSLQVRSQKESFRCTEDFKSLPHCHQRFPRHFQDALLYISSPRAQPQIGPTC